MKFRYHNSFSFRKYLAGLALLSVAGLLLGLSVPSPAFAFSGAPSPLVSSSGNYAVMFSSTGGAMMHLANGFGDFPFNLVANGCPLVGMYDVNVYQGNNSALYGDTVESTALADSTIQYSYSCTGLSFDSTGIINVQALNVPLTCSTFDIACYIKQAFAWTFVPSAASLTQFSTLTLEHSLPFSYGYDMVNIYNEMFPTSGSSLTLTVHTTMGNFDLLSAAQVSANSWYSIVYGAMSALMYLGTAAFLYKQVFGIHDQTHKTV